MAKCMPRHYQRPKVSLNPSKLSKKAVPKSPAKELADCASLSKTASHGDAVAERRDVASDVSSDASPFSVKLRHVEATEKPAAAVDTHTPAPVMEAKPKAFSGKQLSVQPTSCHV